MPSTQPGLSRALGVCGGQSCWGDFTLFLASSGWWMLSRCGAHSASPEGVQVQEGRRPCWPCDGHWASCHGSPRAGSSPGGTGRNRGVPGSLWEQLALRAQRSCRTGCFLGQGKPSPSHSTSSSVVAHKSTAKEVYKRLTSFWRLSKATGVRQSRKTKSPELKYPLVFPLLLFCACSGMNLQPRPVRVIYLTQLLFSTSLSPKDQSSLPAKSRLIVDCIGPGPGIIQLPSEIPLILQYRAWSYVIFLIKEPHISALQKKTKSSRKHMQGSLKCTVQS